MTLTSNLKDQLTRDEGLRLRPYRDTSPLPGFEGRPGKMTIGIGRNLDDDGITIEEANHLLENDILTHQATLLRILPWAADLDEARLGVLIAMSFNMGMDKLLGFKKTLALVQSGNYGEAAEEMVNSSWAGQVGARAHRLSLQMKTGQWQ